MNSVRTLITLRAKLSTSFGLLFKMVNDQIGEHVVDSALDDILTDNVMRTSNQAVIQALKNSIKRP